LGRKETINRKAEGSGKKKHGKKWVSVAAMVPGRNFDEVFDV
jgi:hypothetical protein